MSEAVWRLALAGSVAGAAVLTAGFGFLRRRLAADRAASRSIDLSAVEGAVVLFSEASCRSCDSVRATLHALGLEFTEIRYEERPDLHLAAGIESVPLIAVRAADGEFAGQIVGNPSRRRLGRLLRAAGTK